jgi:hypothetical protein
MPHAHGHGLEVERCSSQRASQPGAARRPMPLIAWHVGRIHVPVLTVTVTLALIVCNCIVGHTWHSIKRAPSGSLQDAAMDGALPRIARAHERYRVGPSLSAGRGACVGRPLAVRSAPLLNRSR